MPTWFPFQIQHTVLLTFINIIIIFIIIIITDIDTGGRVITKLVDFPLG